MPVYDRGEPTALETVDDDGPAFGWQAHPDEDGRRTSHAVVADGEVWLLDPLDAPGLDERLAESGPVAGVVVCSNWHARDAGRLAERHGVAVHAPRWLSRVEELVDAPIRRFDDRIAGFEVLRVDPLPGWQEAQLYRPRDGTLYSPDVLSRLHATAGERIGLVLPCRANPPRERLGGREVERIRCGHGRGVDCDAGMALRTALDGAQVRLPRAIPEQTPQMVLGILGAVRE
jgi:hypothetical protein